MLQSRFFLPEIFFSFVKQLFRGMGHLKQIKHNLSSANFQFFFNLKFKKELKSYYI